MSKFLGTTQVAGVLVVTLLVGLVLFSLGAVTSAQANPEINYQGKLTDTNGAAVTDGSYNMRFWLSTSPNAATTSPSTVWSEERLVGSSDGVTVTNGLFSVMLGSTTPLTSVDFDQTLYLGVEIGGTAGSPSWDGEMSPRKIIGMVPAAFEARRLGGVASSSFLRSDEADRMSATTASTLFTIQQNGAGNILDLLNSSGSTTFTVLENGNVGVGTTSPDTKLYVAGMGSTARISLDAVSSGGIESPGVVLKQDGAFTGGMFYSELDGNINLFAGDFSSLPRISMTNTGLVGIGTTSPSSKLTVAGDTYLGGALRATGTVRFDSLTNGFLQTDGSGLLSSVATSSFGLGDGTFLGLTDTPNSYTANRVLFTTASAVASSSDFTFDGSNLTLGSSVGLALGSARILFAETGNDNLFLGEGAGNTYPGASNTFIGDLAAGSRASGDYNTFLGAYAGQDLATSSDSVLIGGGAGAGNGTPYEADGLTIVGTDAGYDLETGANNNSFFGYRAGWNVTTGANNLLLGYQAADSLTSGASNIIIGYDVEAPSNTGSNQLNIGNLLFGTSIDGTGTTLSSGNIGIGTTSPSRKLTVAGDTYIGGALRATGTVTFDAIAAAGADECLQIDSAGVVTATGSGCGAGGSSLFTQNGSTTYLTGLNDRLAIGTTSAATRLLEVYGDANAGARFTDSTNDVQLDVRAEDFQGFIGTVSNHDLRFVTNASSKMTLTSGGNLGIGTTSPSRKLTVAGDAYFGGALRATGTVRFDGLSSAGGFGLLVTDANGVVSTTSTSSLGIGGGGATELNDLSDALVITTSNRDSLFIGESAGDAGSAGFNNLGLGFSALSAITNGDDNVGIGTNALINITTGGRNIALGSGAMSDTGGSASNNTAIGHFALASSSGSSNVAVGYRALQLNTFGEYNSALGYEALYNNNGTANGNNAFGYRSLYSQNDAAADFNTAMGYESGYGVTTGAENLFLGYRVASTTTTGSNNIALGSDIVFADPTASNQLNIGNLLFGTGIDGTGTTFSSGNIGIGTTSPSSKLDVWGDFRVGTGSTPSLFVDAAANQTMIGTTTAYNTGGLYLENSSIKLRNTGDLSKNLSIGIDGSGVGHFSASAQTYFDIGGGSDEITLFTNSIYFNEDSNDSFVFRVEGANEASLLQIDAAQDAFGIGLGSPTARLHVENDTSSVTFQVNDEPSDTTPFLIDADGSVGVGTSSPSSKLDVWGDFRVGTGSTPSLFVDAAANQTMIGTTTAYNTGGLYLEDSDIQLRNSSRLDRSTNLNVDGNGYFDVRSTTQTNFFIGSGTNNNEHLLEMSANLFHVNPNSYDKDFRVSGDNDIALLSVNAGTDRVGIGTSSPSAKLAIDNRGYSGTGVVGLDQYYVTENTVENAVQFGNRFYMNASNTATTTIVGGIVRIEDDTLFGNTVRGLEVQANRGVNTLGENTALSGFARTFGVRGTTDGDAGGRFEPAGVYAETRGTTQGNAIRGFSETITTATLLSLFQSSSTFDGTGLAMDFGNGSGSFSSSTSKYLDLKNAGTSKFLVYQDGVTQIVGTTTIGTGDTTIMAGLQIGNGGLCVDSDGSCTASTSGRITAEEYGTNQSDLAEMYFSSESLKPGELVVGDGFISVRRASRDSNERVLGVVSTKPGMTLGFDDSPLSPGQTGYPLALTGRVPVRLSTENGPIHEGDPLTLSSLPGVAMKATEADEIVGYALEDFTGDRAYTDGYINQFGDDIVEPNYSAAEALTAERTKADCYYGAGGASDEEAEACDPEAVVPLATEEVNGPTAEEIARARYEAEQEALAALAYEPAETHTVEGETVKVGQVIMFVERGLHLTQVQTTILNELTSTSTDLVIGAEEGSGETLWSRLKVLAQNFVDGVLAVAGIKADRVETSELCVDDVCVDADDLRALLESSGGGASTDPAASDQENDADDTYIGSDTDEGGEVDGSQSDDEANSDTDTASSSDDMPDTASNSDIDTDTGPGDLTDNEDVEDVGTSTDGGEADTVDGQPTEPEGVNEASGAPEVVDTEDTDATEDEATDPEAENGEVVVEDDAGADTVDASLEDTEELMPETTSGSGTPNQ